MIVFSNSGLIDVRCITTQGVNVKSDAETAIGEFGTGLKIAIAVLLRTGHEVTIYSGNHEYIFATKKDTVRGKEFTFITMMDHITSEGGKILDGIVETQLGFTTDYGKHWQTWMAYRELYSNCTDEKGTVYNDIEQYDPAGAQENWTFITVTGPEIDAIHNTRGQYFLLTKPLWEDDAVAIHPKQEGGVFYRGILAGQFEPSPAYAYNIKAKSTLNEDRTFSNIYAVKNTVALALLKCDDRNILLDTLVNKFEFGLDYNWTGTPPSSTMEELAWAKIKGKEGIPSSLRDALKRLRGDDYDKQALVVPETLAGMLLHEPEAPEETVTHSSIFSGIYAMEDTISKLTAQVTYWRACVQKLADRDEAEDIAMRALMEERNADGEQSKEVH